MAAQFQSAPGPSRPPHIVTNFPTPTLPPIGGAQLGTGRPEPPGAYPAQSTTYQPPTVNRFPSPAAPSSPGPMDMPNPTVAGVRREDSAAKRNPFADLIETEKVYVEQLTLVIRRVAAAWSRRNLPPPKLDAMFRCVEAVYRANRAFGVRLKEIGPNPSDPKSLGDLLMRWIDDLEPAYGRYATIFLAGFNNYAPVASNPLLPPILDEVSTTCPPAPPLQRWSLDALFLLPYTRLRYYRKLYSRLLQNTVEGRSDHRLLATACQRLETLVDDVEDRLETDVSEEETPVPSSAGADDESKDSTWPNEKGRTSGASSGPDSSVESQSVLSSFNSRMDSTRNSQTSAGTSITHSPGHAPKIAVPPLTMPSQAVNDLELRIDCERTIDLFTMKARKCKLHMNPPNLNYQRQIRTSHDVIIYFTPTSTGEQVVHQRAHIFILTDLFLITDRMEAAEKAEMAQQVARQQPDRLGEGSPMPEMWLSYPPLAGKHLAVVEGAQANVVAVTVMRKETFVIHAESEIERDQIMKSIQECIEFATYTSQRTTPLPSPVDGKPRSPVSPGSSMRFPSPMSPMTTTTTSPESSASNLAVPMGSMQLDPTKPAPQWNQQPMGPPMPQVMPQGGPQPQPRAGGHPPRGASLKYPNRVASPQSPPIGPPPMSPSSQRSVPLPMSSMSEPGIPHGPMRNVSMHSTGSRESGPMSHSAASSPRMPAGAFPAMRQPMPQMARQAYGPGPMRTDLPPVPQVHSGSHHSDSGILERQSYPERYMNNGPGTPQGPPRARSAEPFRDVDPMRPPDKPSARFGALRSESPVAGSSPMPLHPDDSPPPSPTLEEAPTIRGPTSITAQMKCKVFLQQGHQQWKSLGHAKLKLYVEKERKIKQLVVEADNRSAQTLISTIVLTDGVERVGKTGVAVEVSDKGQHTGIIYMIQLRNESSAGGLYESLLAGSDRAR